MLFLDTEWADSGSSQLVANATEGLHLVSMALLGRDEQYRWYAERDPLPAIAPDFVRGVVFPLLKRGDHAMRDHAMAHSLHAFIQRVSLETQEKPTIAYDFWCDRGLFNNAWAGLDNHVTDGAPPVEWFDLSRLNPHYTIGVEQHFEQSDQARRCRHHALIDAYAARGGYLCAVRQLAQRT